MPRHQRPDEVDEFKMLGFYDPNYFTIIQRLKLENRTRPGFRTRTDLGPKKKEKKIVVQLSNVSVWQRLSPPVPRPEPESYRTMVPSRTFTHRHPCGSWTFSVPCGLDRSLSFLYVVCLRPRMWAVWRQTSEVIVFADTKYCDQVFGVLHHSPRGSWYVRPQ